MRRASDAQARVLGCLEGHERRGEDVLLAGGADDANTVLLLVERPIGSLRSWQNPAGLMGLQETTTVLREADHPRPRSSTYAACVREGWIVEHFRLTRTSACLGVAWTMTPQEYEVTQLGLTEDGKIALGRWRSRPAAPSPTLDGADRELVALAEHAARLGYKLAPATTDAKAQARRLKREGWIWRGFIGKSVGSIELTEIGRVEVAPERADLVPTKTHVDQSGGENRG